MKGLEGNFLANMLASTFSGGFGCEERSGRVP